MLDATPYSPYYVSPGLAGAPPVGGAGGLTILKDYLVRGLLRTSAYNSKSIFY